MTYKQREHCVACLGGGRIYVDKGATVTRPCDACNGTGYADRGNFDLMTGEPIKDPVEPPKKLSKKRRERIGVPGSMQRRIVDLMEEFDFVLVGAEHFEHPLSRVVLKFDEGSYVSTITVEDTERPKNWKSR